MFELSLINHNPDVLNCIANLSNDEVFTPPDIANKMLDQVAAAWEKDHNGEILWENPNVTFLDPFTKSGVFLREITSRLRKGLIFEIPDLQQRVNHILTHQVFGVGITNLTALLSRRSLYCSKWADGKHSICTDFNSHDGNIWFERTEHTWVGGTPESRINPLTGEDEIIHVNRRCSYCGASEDAYARGDNRETHAYSFIHADDINARLNEIFGGDMHFDVVIGNPPYQLSDGGFGKSAAPIYQLFVEQAKKLDPSYLSMIIPSRWFAGGKGLDEFRNEMLNDDRLIKLVDYLNAADVFPGVDFKGGVCYFLWNRDKQGDCTVRTFFDSEHYDEATRSLTIPGSDVFIRFNRGIEILQKILDTEKLTLPLEAEKSFETLVSSRKPFGLATNFKGSRTRGRDSVTLYQNGGTAFVERDELRDSSNLVDQWKIFVNYVGPGNNTYPHRVLVTPFIGEPGSASTETYLAVGGFTTKEEAESALSYMTTRVFRFLLLLRKASQHVTGKVYAFVPKQIWDHNWTDQELYKKYDFTAEEIQFIESMISPMDVK